MTSPTVGRTYRHVRVVDQLFMHESDWDTPLMKHCETACYRVAVLPVPLAALLAPGTCSCAFGPGREPDVPRPASCTTHRSGRALITPTVPGRCHA